MSKNIMIPTSRDPFVVVVNGKKYSYKAGQIYSVPDEVAAVIESHIEMQPKPTLFGNTEVEKETKKNYAITDALSRNDLTVIPWREYRYEDIYEVYYDDAGNIEYEEVVNGDSFFGLVFEGSYKPKANIVVPPTIGFIPRLANSSEKTKIDNIWIPSTVTVIKSAAFEACYGTIKIPTSVKHIEKDAFYDGIGEAGMFKVIDLTDFVTEPFPSIDSGSTLDGETVIKVARGRKEELANMTGWSEGADNIVEV